MRYFAFLFPYTLLMFICSATISWVVLAKFDFFYAFWLDHGGIGEAIDHYGPQNRFKQGFGETSREQRISLFSEINKQVHGDGRGLRDIAYATSTSQGQQTLLRTPEVEHLFDVVKLIDKLTYFAVFCFFLWPALLFFQWRKKMRLPPFWQQVLVIIFVVILATLVTFIIGPVTVFNTLHIWVFPKEHQWFFYYQDSLMSTLMFAPNLFGWIALELVCLSIVIFVSLSFALDKIYGRRFPHDRVRNKAYLPL